MSYQSIHTGAKIDAAVSILSDIQVIRDESSANLAAVQSLSGQVSANAAASGTSAGAAQQAAQTATERAGVAVDAAASALAAAEAIENTVSTDGSVLSIVKLTQAQYDALTPDATTLYIIEG